jgi:16S rRNA (cytidine1402-2'-O)-methyltransferase
MPLFVVATPIGNLGDLTERAREVLASCDAVIAEDTRHSDKLLRHIEVHKPLISLPAFDEAARIPALIRRLGDGQTLALITDAGTPAISDPGAFLVRAAIEAGIVVTPIPGASAVVAAVSVSGFLEGRFHFAGFLPRTGPERAELVQELKHLRSQLVFYESPNRLRETLADLRSAFGDRPAMVARELTKLHEELARGSLSELENHFAEGVRGECAIVVSGAPAKVEEKDPALLDAEVRKRLASGERPKEIAEALALEHGKREVYQLALKIKSET